VRQRDAPGKFVAKGRQKPSLQMPEDNCVFSTDGYPSVGPLVDHTQFRVQTGRHIERNFWSRDAIHSDDEFSKLASHRAPKACAQKRIDDKNAIASPVAR
jgi:hypothetical protein